MDWERTRAGGLGKGSAASPPASHTAVYRGMHLLVFWSSLGWMLLGELESTFFSASCSSHSPIPPRARGEEGEAQQLMPDREKPLKVLQIWREAASSSVTP